jgi:hypothetical protein
VLGRRERKTGEGKGREGGGRIWEVNGDRGGNAMRTAEDLLKNLS